jgi:hypothetical protein
VGVCAAGDGVVRVTRRRNNLDWDQRIILRDLSREWPVQRPLPLVLAWYWRYEVIFAVVLGSVLWWLVGLVGALLAGALLLAVLALIGGVPRARAVAIRAWWHVVTPHRIRRGLVEAGVYSRKGRIPEVLRVRSVSAGEVVTLWCFAGTSFEDIVARLSVIGTACYAREMQAVKNQRRPHLVQLLVVRHPDVPPPSGDWPSTRPSYPRDDAEEPYRPEATVSQNQVADGGVDVGQADALPEVPSQRHHHGLAMLGGEL